jgi:hypothetical protein
MGDSLKFGMLKWQQKVFADKTRFKVVVAGRRCGKTRMSAVTLLVKALENTHKDATVLYVAPTYSMAKTLMWDLLLTLAQPVVEKSNVNDGEITLVNGSKIRIRGADNPDSLRGMKLAYCVVDEMKDIKATTWELILRPALSDLKAGALIIGTPEPGESLFREYFDLGMSETDPEWRSWHLTTLDNELIDPKEIEAAQRSMSTFAFKQEYLASFDTMGSDVFKEEWFRYGPEPREGDWYIAIDLAGFEDVSDPNKKRYLDDTAIAVVKVTPEGKWWVKKVDAFRKDVRETAVRILMAIRTYRPICVGIEKGSLQRAIMPYLSDLMNKNAVYTHIEAIPTSGKSKENRVIYALQGLFEHGRISFSDDQNHNKLKDQLLMFPSTKTHDDTCFPAYTPIITDSGFKPISEITIADKVLTRKGFKRVLRAWCSGNKEIIERFGIVATPDHRIHTENRGWVRLDTLSPTDILLHAQPIWSTSCEKQYSSTEETITDIQTQNRLITENTTQVTHSGRQPQDSCTVMYGSSITAQSPKVTTFTTSTETTATTVSKTSYAFPKLPTEWNISLKSARECALLSTLPVLTQSEVKLKSGTDQKKDANGIENTLLIPSEKTSPSNLVLSVEQCISQRSTAQVCAATNANESEETTCSERNGVPVYDLMVEDEAEFFAWNILVHNCDALSMIAHLVTVIYGEQETDSYYEPLDEVCGF